MFALLSSEIAAKNYNNAWKKWIYDAPKFLDSAPTKLTIPEQNAAAYKWYRKAPKVFGKTSYSNVNS